MRAIGLPGEEGTFCTAFDPITGIRNMNPNNDMVQFDNFGIAVLTVFTMLTLEGWTDVMYAVQDGLTGFAWIYFVMLISFGTISVKFLFGSCSEMTDTVFGIILTRHALAIHVFGAFLNGQVPSSASTCSWRSSPRAMSRWPKKLTRKRPWYTTPGSCSSI